MPTRAEMSHDQRVAMMRAHADQALERARVYVPPRALQETVSLLAWRDRCVAAGVPMVPVMEGPALTEGAIFGILDGKALDGDDLASYLATEAWLRSEVRESVTMWRWDCCAPLHLKHAMATGDVCAAMRATAAVATREGALGLEVDDPRFVDIMGANRLDRVAVCVRPWVHPVLEAGYPVEFRVFVTPDGRAATTSYYPQRSLDAAWRPVAEEAQAMALALRAHVPADVGYSLDIIVRPTEHRSGAGRDVECLVLEGGPGWGHGAHPCCFAPATLTAFVAGNAPGLILFAPEDGAVTR